jgi:ATP-dependent exoDNAse (exonuclease V) beta subunit
VSREGPTPRALPDAEARRRIQEDLGSTLFVEAAAGTGKTTALVSRMVALLRSGRATLDRIVAVTFTEKAAGELKLRVREEIERVRGDGATPAGERARLDAALAGLELARIGTIHGFCADLLRERPVEARVDPLFEVAADDEASALVDRAFAGWFQRALADPPEGVRRVLRRRSGRDEDGGPRAMLRAAVERLVEHRDFAAAWRQDPFDRDAEIDRLLERLAEVSTLAARARRPDDYLARSFQAIAAFVEEVRVLEAVRGRDHDGLEAELRAFARGRHWRWTGGRAPYGRDLSREEAVSARDRVERELDRIVEACDADLAPRLREELREVVAAYEAEKARAGKLDFLDLLIRARDLIRGDETVRRDFQARYSHFFVDEFQDTDPLQVEILLLLAARDPGETDWREAVPSPGKLFLVGDPKQSIYRFRRADVALYEEVKRRLLAAGAELVHLTASFRGLPAIQAVVNAAFEPAMRAAPDASQAAYVALEPVREERRERPALVVLPVPRPYVDYGDGAEIRRWKIEESFPDAVAAFVDWLVRESAWTVEEAGRPGSFAGVAPRHVCILLRRFQSWNQDTTRPYARALEARRIPHVLVGGRSFHEREEVLAIRNALAAIEWPDDELRVFATLRGPLVALGDDALLAFRHAHRGLRPLAWLARERRAELEGSDRDVADALALLAELHRERNRRPIAHTIERLLEAVRAHAGVAIWATGEQALANCLRTLDLARRFERRGAPSFRAFVEHLEEEAERGESEDAPVVEEGTEGVRIMTVHRAKGLEFPVVILGDPTANATPSRPTRRVDPERRLWAEPLCGSVPPELRDAASEELRRDSEEAVRVAYVAATRARDLLVLPGVGDLDAGHELVDGWLGALNPAVYPPRATRRAPELAPGCPGFGGDGIFERPESCRLGPGASVAPGLHRGAVGGHPVVWWDPAALRLDVQEEVGLRQQRILAADEGEVVAQQGFEAHERWQRARAALLEAASAPSIRVQAITAAADGLAGTGEAGAGVEVALEEMALDRTDRPGGARFGVLVHAALAAVDLEAGREGASAAARAQGRLVGASEEEVAAAADAVHAALQHPLLRRAAAAARRGDLRRETPVLLRLDDGSLLEGVVDLAFREKGPGGATWTVVDFKTDRELAASRERYATQVRLYARAIAAATGERVRGVLLRI